MKKFLIAVLLFLHAPLFAARVFEQSTVANLSTCGSPTIGNVYYVTDGADATDCSAGSGSSKHACVCNGTSWVIVGDGTGGVGDADYGDIVVSGAGTVWTVDTNSVALGADTTGDYVSAVTANQGLLLTGTEGASVGLIDCDENQIVKSTGAGGTSWACAADETGAPTGVDYLVKTADAGLSGERVVTDTGTVTWDWATAGQAKATCVDVTCTNCLGGTEITESSLGAVPTADALSANPAACATGEVVTDIAADGTLTCTPISNLGVAPYGQYDVDRPPTNCAVCDEFVGDTAQQSWSWGNQGGATITYELDGARLDVPAAAGVNERAQWLTGPDGSSTDFVVTMKFSALLRAAFNDVGIALLYSGSIATPTSIRTCTFQADLGGLGNYDLATMIFTNYTTWSSSPSILDTTMSGTGPFWLRMRYVTSTKGLYCGISSDGVMWYEQAVSTLAAHPTTTMGFIAESQNASNSTSVFVYYWRARTDTDGITYPYMVGM